MLVPAMNNEEVTAEILRDFEKLNKSTINRLTDEYDRERKNLKIDKARSYPKNYPIKTASKNTWIIFFEKSPSLAKYRNAYDAVGCAVVYYYSSMGLKAFRYNTEGKYIEVFNGHFFARYNERMQLNLPKPIDVIKSFFTNSGYLQISITKKEGRQYTVGVCREGQALGEYYATDVPWLIHKTFINHALKKPAQEESEKLMLLKARLQLFSKSVLAEFTGDPAFKASGNVLAQLDR